MPVDDYVRISTRKMNYLLFAPLAVFLLAFWTHSPWMLEGAGGIALGILLTVAPWMRPKEARKFEVE